MKRVIPLIIISVLVTATFVNAAESHATTDGFGKYECNGQCYEREFRADAMLPTLKNLLDQL
jgi:hypothetical protein